MKLKRTQKTIAISATISLIFAISAYAQIATPPQLQPNDQRKFVEMPPRVQQNLREEMLIHQVALIQVYSLIAENKLDQAASIAETQLGMSSMGKHRGTGMGPGRYLPFEMRKLGWKMHQSASDFAQFAKAGQKTQAEATLQEVTAACTACHYNYRVTK
jgi:hypothetical protein